MNTIKKRLDFGFSSSRRRSSSGRKPVMMPRAKRILLLECKKNRKMTSKQLQGALETDSWRDVFVAKQCSVAIEYEVQGCRNGKFRIFQSVSNIFHTTVYIYMD